MSAREVNGTSGGAYTFSPDLSLYESPQSRHEFIYDRWPLITMEYERVTAEILHVAFQGAIFQQYQWSTKSDPIHYSSGSDITMAAKLRIRDLDFIDTYEDGYGFILEHKDLFRSDEECEEWEKFDSVFLAVSIFVNGVAQTLELSNNYDDPVIVVNSPEFFVVQGHPLQITVGYKILVRDKFWDGNSFPITQDSLCAMHMMLRETSFTRLELSRNVHMDFIMRRNLEHILSVCSIPTPQPDRDGIALTCGDISGHRIVNSASFLTFQFLLSMYEHLGSFQQTALDQSPPTMFSEDRKFALKGICIESLQKRIEKVCRGHVAWLKQAEKVDGCFGANYWVTGKLIIKGDSNSHMGAESLTDTPFQLIKLADYGRLFNLDKDNVFLTELKALATNWIQVLETANARGFYAFPRPKTDPTTLDKFRLDDHVWMWRALSAVRDMVRGNELGNLKLRSTRRRRRAYEESSEKEESSENVESKLNAEYSPEVFQKHVLRRFTTENPVSKQRMLAVARSPVENRFYLHSRDVALLYRENSAFFFKHDALWKATMNVQEFHEESEDFGRGNPLRYTLDIMRGTIDRTAAKDILLQSSSANGLFPGALDPLTKEPEMFYEEKWRDHYWHRTFEVPYILWKCRESDLFQSVLSKDPAHVQKESINVPVQVQKDFSYVPAHTQRNLSIIRSKVQKEFNDALAQGFQAFFHPELSAEDTVPVEDTAKYKDTTVIPYGVIIDIPKTDRSKEYKDPLLDVELLDNEDMYNKLRKERSVHNSKKRLIWITNPDTDTKRFCSITSADDESDSLNLFFERHNSKSKYFSDEVTATANLWTTELHLSSYRLINQPRNGKRAGMPFLGNNNLLIERAGAGFRFVGDFFDRYWTCHALETEPEFVSPSIKWTGLASEDEQETTEKLDKILKLRELKLDFERHKEPWKQRKVLELLLLDRMLRELTQRYDEIIGEIGQQLERLFVHTAKTDSKNIKEEKAKGNIVSISNELFSRQMNNGAYLVFRKTWPALQYSLQVTEEDLKEVLEKIDIWNTRKADRRPEEPRWTKNDEGRYRAAITKLTNENLHAIRDLRYRLATIQSLRVSLSSGLDSTRDELSFQNAENIRYFTFLTAVFLPLGFATGIWSMADSSPRSESIKGMVVTAVITLFLTFTVLINVQRLNEYLSLYTSRTFWEKRNGAQTSVRQEQQGDPSERDSATRRFSKLRGFQLPGLRKRTEARKSNESLA
ncbi:hypothetical protein GT037_001737 [Alternaria burnsii]|uniref:Mg2+ transporter zinc transport protein n=1 Tax=Alternaria burnsii TaxID=1187904 RepID=A0A8H7EIH2_9PLEO|nr:uncharacterized protein GT037_001737 [Alternaria burnsii]KAF7680086.1 hypothetical protein GT037_001737 [Alternaria burnsii]